MQLCKAEGARVEQRGYRVSILIPLRIAAASGRCSAAAHRGGGRRRRRGAPALQPGEPLTHRAISLASDNSGTLHDDTDLARALPS